MRTREQAHGETGIYPCTYCGANPGQPCLTDKENKSVWPHANRMALAYPWQGWYKIIHPWSTPYGSKNDINRTSTPAR